MQLCSGWIRVFGTRICNGLCNGGLGLHLNALLLGVQTGVRFHLLFRELVRTRLGQCFRVDEAPRDTTSSAR